MKNNIPPVMSARQSPCMPPWRRHSRRQSGPERCARADGASEISTRVAGILQGHRLLAKHWTTHLLPTCENRYSVPLRGCSGRYTLPGIPRDAISRRGGMMAASSASGHRHQRRLDTGAGAQLAVRGENISNVFGLAGLGNANDRPRAHI